MDVERAWAYEFDDQSGFAHWYEPGGEDPKNQSMSLCGIFSAKRRLVAAHEPGSLFRRPCPVCSEKRWGEGKGGHARP